MSEYPRVLSDALVSSKDRCFGFYQGEASRGFRSKMSSSLGAMGSLPGKLRSLLVSSRIHLPDPLKDEIKLLITDLEEACAFLLDLSRAEAPPSTMVKLWRNEVREMSYDMEDYIDKTTPPYSNQFDVEEFGVLVELARDACKSYHRYHIGRLWPSRPSFMAGGHGRVPTPTLNREAPSIVGMDDAKQKLISWLRVRDNVADQGLRIVPILGPAGVGKTTLAREVYREIGGEFECRAFVRASRMPDTRRLLQSIISQIQRHQRPSYDYTVQELIDSLREHLQHKRYFIVIDGLWETSSWDIVTSALPERICCSRIMITTDIDEVALECSDYQSNAIFLMEPLSRDYSAELLNNGMWGCQPKLSEQLKEKLEDIIRTCGGLPLAITSIANILASKRDNSLMWCQVKECISSRLRNNLTLEGILREIVGLSYDCLPHDMKICLLYLSVYPEGYTFFKADLLKQWTAEGFISTQDANEVAESYFDELVCWGLIQPNHIDFTDRVVSYTLHSTVFEVIRYKSIEENFTTVIDYSNTIPELSAKVRRLSLGYSNAKYVTKPEGITLSPVRSLIFYGHVECLPSLMEFEVLRVLNLEFWGSKKELDLSGISQLFQLRYIRIIADIIVKLPAKIKGLQYLETLEICGRVTSVPSDIVHLPRLLHLCLYGEITLSDGISHMRSLRTLHSFDLSSNSEGNVWCIGEMTDLHDLHLTCSKSISDLLQRNLLALASSIGKLGKLKSFVLAPDTSCSSVYSDCSSRISCLPVLLQRLELLPPICIFSRLPKWIEQLRKLCVLKIVVRELTRDDIDTIAGLQELVILSLFVRQPSAERIVFNRAAFPVLKYFKYRCGILRLSFHAETMPSLRRLKLEFNVHSGDQYDDMLTGIENLLKLQELAGRIGVVPGAVESDWIGAESAFKDAIIKHSKPPAVDVRRVDLVDKEHVEQFFNPGTRTMPPAAHKHTTEEKRLASSSAPFFEVPVTNVSQVRLLSHEASSRATSLHGGMFHKNTGGARTRSLSPVQRRHAIASIVRSMDDLKSLSQPLSANSLPQPVLRPPAHIGSCPIPSTQWKKGKLLGSGTFGQVYFGFNSESGQFCAIKEVKVILDDPKSKERLRQLNQEVEILTQLSHPNIVQYYGSELNDESLSIYLEYVSGGSIHQLLRNYGPFKEPVIRNYTRLILSGLAYLHGMKTMHSDIKGANVLVGPSGEVKLADFGMVKPITSLAEMHFFKGSIYWMAPEVIKNKNGYSLEADIWSLGCTIIEMGTGKHPWHAYEDVAALFKIANNNQIPEIPESFSKEGKDFLSMCLKRDPTQRPAATWLLGHPFVQDHQATRQTQCNPPLRNKLSSPAKQKIVIKLSTQKKYRTKAMAIAARADGVSSIAITGDDGDMLEVVGDGIDSVRLARELRKKIGSAEIVEVASVQKNN